MKALSLEPWKKSIPLTSGNLLESLHMSGSTSPAHPKRRHLPFLRKAFPFFLPLILTFLPILALHFGRLQQAGLQKERFQEEWHEQAIQKVELYRQSFSFEKQIDQMARDFRNDLHKKLARTGRPLSVPLFLQSFRKAFAPSHVSSETRIYAYSVNAVGRPELLRGQGLTEIRGKIIVSLLSQMTEFDRLTSSEQRKLADRVRNIFGESLNIRVVAKTRKGFFTRGFFEGRRVFFVWNHLAMKGKPVGGYLLVSPETLEISAKPLEFALGKLHRETSDPMVPILFPMEPASSAYRVILLSTLHSAKALTAWRESLTAKRTYDGIASFGTIFEPGPDCWMLRSPVSIKLPYELWMILVQPQQFLQGGWALDRWTFLLWALFWLGVFLHLLFHPVPLGIRVRQYFAGFMVLVGAIPLALLLFVIGFPLVENLRDNRIGAVLRQQREVLEEADFRCWSKLAQFSELCRSTLLDPGMKSTFSSPDFTLSNPRIRRCFDRFLKEGIPLESLTSFQFSTGTIFLSDLDNSHDEQAAISSMFLPIMYGCYGFLHGKELFQSVIRRLKETERICITAFQAAATPSIYEDLALMRNNAQTFDFDSERVFTFFDFIGNGAQADTGVLFRCRTSRTFQGFLQDTVKDLALRFPAVAFSWGRMTPDGIAFAPSSAPPRSRRAQGLQWLRRAMLDASRTGVPRTLIRGNQVFLAHPCQQMPGQILGAWFSLKKVQDSIDVFRKGLITLITILSLFTALVAFGMARYFLDPLKEIEGGLRRVSEGDLEVRLGLPREDELGEATRAFDEMITGLQERRELGRFVSATLESSLKETHDGEVRSFAREGVVLASDIRSFTTLSEAHSPESIVSMLNTHLDEMSRAIQSQGGLIDKFIGDAVVAVFWDDDPTVALENALNAGLLMMRAHRFIDRRRSDNGMFTYRMGVGIARGSLAVGAFGSADRREYTVVGEVRSRAEELEAASKAGQHTSIVIAHDIPEQVSGYSFVPLGEGPEFELLDDGRPL